MKEIQENIDQYIASFTGMNNRFQSLINIEKDRLSTVVNTHTSELKSQEEHWIITQKDLTFKLEKLNDEIVRYGSLLKKEFKLTELSGVLKERFQEIEVAVSDYVNLKLRNFSDAHRKKLDKLEQDLNESKNEIALKIGLLEDDFDDALTQLHEQWELFKKENIDNNKGLCSHALLKNFEEPSFENISSSFALGNKSLVINAKNVTKTITYPELVPFNDHQNICIVYDSDTSSTAENISDTLIFRMLFSHIPDKLKVHIYDQSMNEKFREFLPLPSMVLDRGFEWSQFQTHLSHAESLIRSKLGLLFADISSDHNSLHEYNLKLIKEEKYDEILPYFLFVFDDFLSFKHEQSLKEDLARLDKLLQYGCQAIILINKSINPEKFATTLSIVENLRFKVIDLTIKEESIKNLNIENISNDDKKILLRNFITALENLASTRSKVKFKSYAVPEKSNWFKQTAFSEVKIPIGKSELREGFEHLSFKTKDMLSNALLCGGVGSGKTNFLKTVITSLSLNYSPQELELWLVDMKNGAGFSVFNNCQLPHATKYAFSAESELINDLFFQLKKEMDERYAYFAQFSVDNLADASKLENIDESKLRRIVLIIDEFASIFTEDAAFLDEISTNLLSIIQKGRAMGINLLLAAQNFSNIRNSSFYQAVTLIPTRVLLKSSPEAAKSVLGYGNKGSIEITKIGQGLINNNFGEINNDGGNFFFRSFILDNEDLEPILGDIKSEISQQQFSLAPIKFIDASLPATFETNEKLFNQLESDNYESVFHKTGLNCYLGESYLMNEDNHFSFKWKVNGRQSLQNVIISGNEREHSSQALLSILSSLTYGIPKGEFAIKWLNALDEETAKDLSLDLNFTNLSNYDIQSFATEELECLIAGLEHIMNSRRTSKDRIPVITFLIGLEKLIKLHSANYSETELTSRLKVLMSTGSNYGIYFVCEMNKPSSLDKISRDLIGFFEHRICYFVNADESNYLMNSKAASQLINMDAPTIRNKALYFSQSEAVALKFKSYHNFNDTNDFIRPQQQKNNLNLLVDCAGLASTKPTTGEEPEATVSGLSLRAALEKYPHLMNQYKERKNE